MLIIDLFGVVLVHLSARLWSNVLSEDVLFEAAFKIHDDIIVPPLILLSIEIILAKTV